MKTTKKQVCSNNKAFAYYSGLGGLEIHYIDYGIDDYVYYTIRLEEDKPSSKGTVYVKISK